MLNLAFISIPGGAEWLVIGFVGLLLFGKRLPEVAQSLGKSVTEFKKGLQGIGTDEPSRSLPASPAVRAPLDTATALPESPREPEPHVERVEGQVE